MRRTAWLFAALAPLAAADEHPRDFAYTAPISAPAGASHYRVTLPKEAYRGAARRDLGDVRIFNAAGEPVPYAFVRRDPPKAAPEREPAQLFPLYGDGTKGLDATAIRVQRNASGTLVSVSVSERPAAKGRQLLGYVIDVGDMKPAKQALLLDWQTAQSFAGQARVEATEDFKSWHPVATNAPILSLRHDGATLERSRVELSATHARYLRLSLSGIPSEFALKQVRVELRPEEPVPTREWASLEGTADKVRGEWLFDTAGHFPVDRVRLQLPEPNTVVNVQLSTRERPEDNWRRVGSAVAYRLAAEGAELRNADIAVRASADRYWLVSVEQTGGGIGAGPLGLEIGWLPQEVVFAARGAGPFSVAFGSEKHKPGALPIASVLPARPNGESLLAQPAEVGPVSGAVDEPSLFGDPVRYAERLAARRDVKKWVLWSALVAGVAFLGWMALRLLRDMNRRA